jgi:DNA-binding NtrC family response regulator
MSELEEWVDKPYKEARRLFDLYYLRIQVEKTKGDISAAALRAGIHRTMFYRKVGGRNEYIDVVRTGSPDQTDSGSTKEGV